MREDEVDRQPSLVLVYKERWLRERETVARLQRELDEARQVPPQREGDYL